MLCIFISSLFWISSSVEISADYPLFQLRLPLKLFVLGYRPFPGFIHLSLVFESALNLHSKAPLDFGRSVGKNLFICYLALSIRV